jgi:hypothetical protein
MNKQTLLLLVFVLLVESSVFAALTIFPLALTYLIFSGTSLYLYHNSTEN